MIHVGYGYVTQIEVSMYYKFHTNKNNLIFTDLRKYKPN